MKRGTSLSRREFLGKTSATLSAAAIGCGGGEGSEESSGTSAGAGASGRAGAGGSAGAGASAGAGGNAGAGAGGSAGVGRGAGAGAGGSAGAGASAGAGGTGGGPGMPTGAGTVAAVSVGDLDEAVARAVELAGGLDAIGPGHTVFIKPNAVSDRAIGSTGIRTSPEVLASVVRLVKASNPGRIIVGDRSARAFPDTEAIFQVSGLADAALSAGADEVFAAQSPVDAPDEWVLMTPDGWEESWAAAGGILAMRRLVEADHVINVPTCKNHRYALFSLSMKNFIGGIGDSSRDPLHYVSSIGQDFEPLGREIAIINQLFSPLMNVLDATSALINGGPQGDGSDAVRTAPGLIMASSDRVALDALGVSLLKVELGRTAVPTPDASFESLTTLSPWQLPQIVHAQAFGLGAMSPDTVTLALEGVGDAEELEAIFRTTS